MAAITSGLHPTGSFVSTRPLSSVDARTYGGGREQGKGKERLKQNKKLASEKQQQWKHRPQSNVY